MPHGQPSLYDRYLQQARLAEEFDLDVDLPMGRTAFLAVRRRAAGWPFLVVPQRYALHAVAAACGAVLLPETHRLFIAVGERCWLLTSGLIILIDCGRICLTPVSGVGAFTTTWYL